MITFDVNVMVEAFREDAPRHASTREWLAHQIEPPRTFAVIDIALSGFLRVVTHRRVFANPSSIDSALEFADALMSRDNCIVVRPGRRHWGIFTGLCRAVETKGNQVPDAYLAAAVIESGCELATYDRGLAAFPALRWHVPAG